MSRWIDFRAVFVACALAVAAALPSITTSVERREFYFFDVTLTSNTVGSTQFFWDYGQGFSEYQSSRQPIKIEPEPVVYRFMMPMGKFTALRFDPIDGSGEFTLKNARIVDYRGRLLRAFSPEDWVPGNGIRHVAGRGDTLEVYTDSRSSDPILNLRLSTPLEVKSTPAIWWKLGAPTFFTAFAVGLVLSLSPVSARLTSFTARLLQCGAARPGLSIGIMAAIVVAVQCHPVIFQGRSFASPNNGGHMLYEGLPALPGDTDALSTNTGSSDTGALLFQHLYYPMVQRDALKAGEFPLWNRYSLSGEPLLGQGQSMFGDPFNFLTIAADGAAWAWDVRFLIARWILAAALGGIVWRLTRHLGASWLTTIGAGFLGFFTYRLVHPANFSVCYAPVILFAWTVLHEADTKRRLITALAGLVATNWLTMTSGTVKEAYMLMVGLNFAGVVLLFARPECAVRRSFVLMTASAAGFGFVLLSAPLWVSFLSAWGHSMTGYDTPQAHTLPWAQMIGFFDDIFYRQAAKDENVVAPALNFFFLVGFLWWCVQPRATRQDRVGHGLLLAMLPPYALAFGLVPPAVIERIPFVGNIVHVGNTFSCVLLSLAAVLAGLGMRDAWTSAKQPGSFMTVLRVWAALAALAILYFVTTSRFEKSPFFTGYAASLLIAAALLPWALSCARRDAVALAPLWVALAIGGPLFGWRHAQYRTTDFSRYTFVPGPRSDIHAPSPAIELVKRDQAQPGRVNGWNSVLYASYNTVPRLEGVYGVDAVRSRHYHDLADALGLERVWNWDWPNRESQSRELVRSYDLYNVTHWLATPVSHGAPHAIEGLTPLSQADLNVYRSPTAWPRAFFTDRIVRYDTPADFARLLLEGDGRPFAAMQGTDADALSPRTATTVAPNRVVQPAQSYELGPNRTRFTVHAPAAGVAVLTETFYVDDFIVTVNAQPADYFRANHAFKAVALPAAGVYDIEFRYWPKRFTAALWCGLAGAVFLALGAVRLSRANFPPASPRI